MLLNFALFLTGERILGPAYNIVSVRLTFELELLYMYGS